MSTASSAVLGKDYKGQIAINDDKDFYKFTLSSSLTISIRLDATIEAVYVKLYDENGKELKSWSKWKNDTSQKINMAETAVLEKGTYYLAIVRYGNDCGDYISKQ